MFHISTRTKQLSLFYWMHNFYSVPFVWYVDRNISILHMESQLCYLALKFSTKKLGLCLNEVKVWKSLQLQHPWIHGLKLWVSKNNENIIRDLTSGQIIGSGSRYSQRESRPKINSKLKELLENPFYIKWRRRLWWKKVALSISISWRQVPLRIFKKERELFFQKNLQKLDFRC